MKLSLNDSIRYIKGVGPSREKLFNNLNIYTIKDLLFHFPRDYEDRTEKKKIFELMDGEKTSFCATISGKVTVARPRGNMVMIKANAVDETGSVSLVWFNATYVKNILKTGATYTFYGQIKRTANRIEVVNPIFDDKGNKNTGKILGVYPSTNGLSQTAIRTAIENIIDEGNGKTEEYMPESIRLNNDLEEINSALYSIHFPTGKEDYIKARRRLVFDELLLLELGLMQLKNSNNSSKKGIKFNICDEVTEFIDNLSFKLTNAQSRVIKDIFSDMNSDKAMNRLLQGDVGSGKTIVAAISIFNAVKNGYQAVMMAPTGILAEQHFNEFTRLFGKYDISVELLSGSLTAKQKKTIKEKIENGEVDIVVGTHALLEDDVVFNKLGLIVTDEQHRFGVNQRSKLAQKGQNPDVLIMTATPIPRTLALILYGDLDISVIDELPPNRKVIETFLIGETLEERLNGFIKKEIDEGRQAYVVCPLIEEQEESLDDEEEVKLKNVAEVYECYKKIFPNYNIEILHGKMRPKDKDEIMLRFKNGEVDILISTTVIEVGVNVPNATLMIIENAERFGLAALHQLRGRVGRGSEKSYCILKCYKLSKNTKERMEIMTKTNDGFKIAEKDLELRGPGEFFGVRQHGIPEFKIANIFADKMILEESNRVAKEIIKEASKPEFEPLFEKVEEKFSGIVL